MSPRIGRWWLLPLGLAVILAAELLLRGFADFRIDAAGGVLRREDGGVEFMRRRYQVDGVDMWEYRTDRPRPPHLRGDVRIVGIGDSIMMPFRLHWKEGFFHLLLEELRRANPKLSYDGVNLAEGGHNLLQDKIMLREQGLAYKPTLVLLQVWQDDDTPYKFIGNDLYIMPYLEVMRRRQMRRGVSRLLQRSYIYTAIELRRLRDCGSSYPPLISMAKQVREIHGLCRRTGAGLVVILFPTLDRPFAIQVDPPGYNEIKELAARLAIPVIDMREQFRGVDYRKIRLDTIHYNAQGHRRIADVLFRELRRFGIPSTRRRPPEN